MTEQADLARAREIDRLRQVCAEAYQFAGAVGAPERVQRIALLGRHWQKARVRKLAAVSRGRQVAQHARG